MGCPAPSAAKSTSEPKGKPARRWCMPHMMVHRCANWACSTRLRTARAEGEEGEVGADAAGARRRAAAPLPGLSAAAHSLGLVSTAVRCWVLVINATRRKRCLSQQQAGAPATAGEGRSQRSVAFCTPPLSGVRCRPLVLMGLPSCCAAAAAAALLAGAGNSSDVTAPGPIRQACETERNSSGGDGSRRGGGGQTLAAGPPPAAATRDRDPALPLLTVWSCGRVLLLVIQGVVSRASRGPSDITADQMPGMPPGLVSKAVRLSRQGPSGALHLTGTGTGLHAGCWTRQ